MFRRCRTVPAVAPCHTQDLAYPVVVGYSACIMPSPASSHILRYQMVSLVVSLDIGYAIAPYTAPYPVYSSAPRGISPRYISPCPISRMSSPYQ